MKLLPGPYSTLPVTVRLRSAAPVDNTWSINLSLNTLKLVPSLVPCRTPWTSASGGEYQGLSESPFSEQLLIASISSNYGPLILFVFYAKVISVPFCRDLLIVPFCHHKFEHHFIASIFFIYRRSLCYRAIITAIDSVLPADPRLQWCC